MFRFAKGVNTGSAHLQESCMSHGEDGGVVSVMRCENGWPHYVRRHVVRQEQSKVSNQKVGAGETAWIPSPTMLATTDLIK
jgi:hypothetical protein